MLFSARAGAFLLALAGPALLPAAAAPSPAFRTDDPHYARLYALEDKADALFESDDYAQCCLLNEEKSFVLKVELRGFSKVLKNHPLGSMKNCTEFHGNHSNSCLIVSLENKDVNLTVP